MNPSIYLAGPISGLTYDEATDWREYAAEQLSPEIDAFSPMRGKEFLSGETDLSKAGYDHHPMSTPAAIVARDRNDVMRCDAILMNLLGATTVSIGTTVELGWADMARKPIILVMEDSGNPHEHAFFRQMASYTTPNLDDALKIASYLLLPVRSVPQRMPAWW